MLGTVRNSRADSILWQLTMTQKLRRIKIKRKSRLNQVENIRGTNNCTTFWVSNKFVLATL